MKPFRLTLWIAVMLSACGLIVAPAFASCAYVIEWNGVRYDPWSNEGPVAFGTSVGQATVPFCDDTPGGCEHGHDESIEVFRVAGVDPHVALAATLERVRIFFSQTGSSRSYRTTPYTRSSMSPRSGRRNGRGLGNARRFAV